MSESNGVLITGISSGIGAAIARSFARDGFRVAGTFASNAERAARLVAEVESEGGVIRIDRCDAFDLSGIAPVVDELTGWLGGVDVLVNNVGGPIRRTSFMELDDETWSQAYVLNLGQVVATTRAVLRGGMLAAGRGAIVNISSIASRTGSPGLGVHYASLKAALNVFTLGLAKELGPLGIRVNAIAPGTIDTPMQQLSPPGHVEAIRERIPLRRIGTTDDVVEAVRFVTSDAASFVTGETWFVAGGY
ncbi:MAG: SDR family NAD(P)-dependent oxidoreductase [Ilumatobacteraceae bacterium]